MTTRRASDRNPRATRACARCRKRKIKCDLAYPRCGTCTAVGTECIGFNSATGEEQPRSVVNFLEEKIAKLEIELSSLQPSAAESQNVEAEYMLPETRDHLLHALTLRDVEETRYVRHGAWSAAPYLSSSPVPTLQSKNTYPMRAGGWLRSHTPCQKRDIASIPRSVLDIMLKHYSETYLVQYPILSASELTERCDRVCGRTGTAFDNYVVCMALSISVRLPLLCSCDMILIKQAHTLIHHDHTRATKAADEFWESAVMNLDVIWQQSPLTQLQAIMLMCHYGFVNPSAANSVACSQAAVTLCVQLGLHREPTPENIRQQIDVESQRRIFWTCYAMNAQNQMLMAKAFDIDHIRPSVQYQTVETFDAAIANYLSAFRQLESEITMGLFYPESSGASIAAPAWLEDVRTRTKIWRERLESQAFASKVEFREVMFQYQRLRLSRVSPRFPVPSFSMRRECIAAATFLVAHYCRVMRRGGFFYWHHCCWHLFEIGIVLAEIANAGLDLIWQGHDSFLQPNDAGEIASAMRSIPMVLRSMKHRWPQVEGVALETEQIFDPILIRLDKWITGEITPPLLDAHTYATKMYLFRDTWNHPDAILEHAMQFPASSQPPTTSEPMTMEEVFRVLQPAEPLPNLTTQHLDMPMDAVIPEFRTFDAMLDSGISPTESSLFWHGGGFELDDLFTAFNAGGFY
ncbi:hypothetical protein BJX70DRAFT_317164 [Aspergillus crustosus]